MSRIGDLGTQIAPTPQNEIEGRLTAELQPKEPAQGGFLNAEYLASMVSLVRQPPSLHFNGTSQLHAPIHDQLINETIGPLTQISTGRLAYAVAELVVRREAEVAESQNNGAKKGLKVMGNLARMFEHLALLQQGPGE